MLELAGVESGEAPPDFIYRNYGNIPERAKTATPAIEAAGRPTR